MIWKHQWTLNNMNVFPRIQIPCIGFRKKSMVFIFQFQLYKPNLYLITQFRPDQNLEKKKILSYNSIFSSVVMLTLALSLSGPGSDDDCLSHANLTVRFIRDLEHDMTWSSNRLGYRKICYWKRVRGWIHTYTRFVCVGPTMDKIKEIVILIGKW